MKKNLLIHITASNDLNHLFCLRCEVVLLKLKCVENIMIGFWWIWFCIFFAGYAIVYVIAQLLLKNMKWKSFIRTKVYPLLPLAYVLITTCFWIVILYKGNLGFISKRVANSLLAQSLIGWSLLGLLFWIPSFRKKNYISILHSLPFFMLPIAFIGRNISRYGILERDDILNLFRVYITGAFIYVVVIIILMLAKHVILYLTSPKHHHA
jgi:hypothetical protein